MPNTVVLLGSVQIGDDLAQLVRDLGWSLRCAEGIEDLRELNLTCDIVAVLFNAQLGDTPWPQFSDAARDAAPRAFLITCQRFSDPLSQSDLFDAGIFYNLRLPFARPELRQGLGFVRHAVSQRQTEPAA
jgi:hypothetical protein